VLILLKIRLAAAFKHDDPSRWSINGPALRPTVAMDHGSAMKERREPNGSEAILQAGDDQATIRREMSGSLYFFFWIEKCHGAW